MKRLRKLILEVADDDPRILRLDETLKWGEPSYCTPRGSTLRIDWKSRMPEFCAMYFKCTSKLVPTIRECFGASLQYENNRAVLLPLDAPLPEAELRSCIRMALNYHRVKHLPRLGE